MRCTRGSYRYRKSVYKVFVGIPEEEGQGEDKFKWDLGGLKVFLDWMNISSGQAHGEL